MTTHAPSVQTPVAIIGMGSMFAKSANLKAYWRTLFNGIDCISEPPSTHCQLNDYLNEDPKKPDHIYCNRGGFLPAISFDPTEFGIPPTALEATDTSQLLGLVAAKMALRDAGYDPEKEFDREHTSVILGVTGTQELVISLGSRLGHPLWRKALEDKGLDERQKAAIIADISDSYVPWQENSFPGLLGNVVAGRICNRLNLGGTNCVVDAACASSLSAIHLGLMELATGKSNMVVTGGVDTINDIFMHMCFSRTGVLSHTGDARPFSAEADGTVLGEGIGILVLKRLTDAEKDGDRIYAVIRGIGSSSDGKSQSIYAPRPEGQARALSEAYRSAGISPETVELVEAHGTGTRVGDEMEFKALKSVFGVLNPNGNRCALGSVKSMIGHTKAAAGAAGMIKSALALYNKVLPPTLKAAVPDPKLGIESSPFYLNTAPRPWLKPKDHPRRGGVSSFGFGGSNFHVVLEEYTGDRQEIAWDGSVEILAFSGPDTATITTALKRVDAHVDEPAWASALGHAARALRKTFDQRHSYRLTLVADTTAGVAALKTNLLRAMELVAEGQTAFLEPQGIYFAAEEHRAGKIAFMFPGQGSQYPHMGRDLTCCFPGAMTSIEAVEASFDGSPTLGELIFPRPALSEDQQRQQADALRRTDVAQPAIGAVSLAMLAVLDHFGLRPDATCGHSYGELPALFAAGWIDRQTLSDLSVTRGRLMAEAGGRNDSGTMLAVNAPIAQLETLVEPLRDVVLANINSPDQGVLSGTTAAVATAESTCRQKGYRTITLPVAAAFHSPLVDAAREPFTRAAGEATITPSRIPVYANVTASPYPTDPSQAADLLGRQLTASVRFQETIEALYAAGVRTFVEVGPKAVLCGLVRATLKEKAVNVIALDRSAGKASGIQDLARTIGHLTALGVDLDLQQWEAAMPAKRPQKMAIPLSGTNYRTPRDRDSGPRKVPVIAPVAAASKPAPVASPSSRVTASPKATNIPKPMHKPNPQTPQPEPAYRPDGIDPADSTDMNATLAIVQQGLASIQSLQQETARAHEAFLETQAQASRTLREMMQSTRMVVGSALGMQPTSLDPTTPAAEAVRPIASQPSRTPIAPAAQSGPAEPNLPTPAPQASASPAQPLPVEPSAEKIDPPEAVQGLSAALLTIVSELTGYPTEMLGLEMDIEADLGIDSIKRVEILSAMETQMPHLPQVTPEMVGTLKTLGQICDFLAGSPSDDDDAPHSAVTTTAVPNDIASPVQDTLLAIVSELTGYPVEMLGLEMDIEADLGIDSIKRVEILSAMETQMPHLPQVTPEMVGTLKTLGQICAFLAGGDRPPANSTDECAAPNQAPTDTQASADIPRQTIRVVEAPKASGRPLRIAAGRWIGILSDDDHLSRILVDELASRDMPARAIRAEALDQEAAFTDMAGLMLWGAIDPEVAFLAAKQAAPQLREAARSGDALFAAVTHLDGAFGFGDQRIDDPVQGALVGLVKTAALEWEAIVCRTIDLAPAISDRHTAAGLVVAELLEVCDHDPVEIGMAADRRVVLRPELTPISEGSMGMDDTDLVVITGGGRGVTAECALALARSTAAAIALVGRSPLPEAMPDWLRDIDGEAAMKKAIARHRFQGTRPTPKMLEAEYRRLAANRAILQNMDALAAAGVRAGYFSADVTDREALRQAIGVIREQMGPITALIHGAGVLHDRLIVDKSIDQFRQVYATKVGGLDNLLAATQVDELKHLILFSSVSARTGNVGQCDYAMANEVLNKIARVEARRRQQCRVVAINWGPWDGGMVTPALKKAMADKAIGLIPIAAGARLMIAEMNNADAGPVEVLIGSMLTPPSPEVAEAEPLALLERRELDLHRYPVLASHIIGGKPVVPFALITEWIGHGALKANPGFSLYGIDDFRLLSGIRLETERKLVRLMAGKAKKNGEGWLVDVELRNGVKNGKDVIHSRARALIVDRFPAAPVYTGNGKNGLRAFPRDLDAIYGQILFHGDHLRAIQTIDGYSDQGMTARLISAPKPEAWMQDPIRERWMADPMVLDGAFQMAIVWCFEQTGQVCLPSYTRSYRQYRPSFPPHGVTVAMTVVAHTHRKMVADFTFLDDDHQVVATLSGYEATIDESLKHAFEKNVLTSDITDNK